MPLDNILIIESDAQTRQELEAQLRRRAGQTCAVESLAAAQAWLDKKPFALVFAAERLPDGTGSDLLGLLDSRQVRSLVVILAESGAPDSAATWLNQGAFDWLAKPLCASRLAITLRRAEDFQRLTEVNEHLSFFGHEDTGLELLGTSPAMEQLRQTIRKVARTQATVLIEGPAGSGKGLIARALHQQSTRAHQPLMVASCALMPANATEARLFGRAVEPRSDATANQAGLFQLADRGTLLLDEVGAIPLDAQGRLLSLLHEPELPRDSGPSARVDVRVIATSIASLQQLVKRGEFREDLYHRLGIVPIRVPSLQERGTDIPLLADYFRQHFARKLGRTAIAISPASLALLQSQPWPGNVRELQQVIQRAVRQCSGAVIEPEHLGLETNGGDTSAPGAAALGEGGQLSIPPLSVIEKKHILWALEKCRGNRTHAAKWLGISIRTLRNKLKEYREQDAVQS